MDPASGEFGVWWRTAEKKKEKKKGGSSDIQHLLPSPSPSARGCKCSGHNTLQQSQCPDVIKCCWADRVMGPDGRSISRVQWICVWLRLKQTNGIQRKRVTWDKRKTSFSPASAYLSLNTPKRYLLWHITAIKAADGKTEQHKNDVYDKQHRAGQPLLKENKNKNYKKYITD